MFNSRTESYNYINPEENLRRLIVVTEFLLVKNLEEDFILFLQQLRNDDNFNEFKSTIIDLIEEYDITESMIRDYIQKQMMVPVN